MTTTDQDRIATSVKQRLLVLANKRKDDFNHVLIRYGLERLLYRLSKSTHQDDFILKGAMLFSCWTPDNYRATKDLDLLGRGTPEEGRIQTVFQTICTTAVEPDGVAFDAGSVGVARTREDEEYQGLRVDLGGTFGTKTRLRLQIDIGFGDAVTPEPEEVDFPTLVPMPRPRLRIYPKETVIAEAARDDNARDAQQSDEGLF